MQLPNTVPDEDRFEPTYTGTLNEQLWIQETLGEFYFDQLITDVLYKVKGGKEANVYCCAAHPDTELDLVAAKVYRPEAFRAMKNDWLYRVGREAIGGDGKAIRDTRAHRAMNKRTATGRAMRSASWINHEYEALCELFDAGITVPEPISLGNRAILMAYLGDDIRAAPTLHDADLSDADVPGLFKHVFDDIAAMLADGRIHGDLSPYNIMLHDDKPFIIDLPQCIDRHTHPQAFALFARDVDRVGKFFQRRRIDIDPAQMATDMWERSNR